MKTPEQYNLWEHGDYYPILEELIKVIKNKTAIIEAKKAIAKEIEHNSRIQKELRELVE